MQNDINKFNGFIKPPKKVKNRIVIFLVIMSFLCIVLGIFLINNVIILSKYRPNKVINNFYFYIPKDWKNPQKNFYINPSGKCSLQIMAVESTKYRKLKAKYENDLNGKFQTKKINNKDWQYLKIDYSESGKKVVYLIKDDVYGNYSLLFIKTSDVDDSCNDYLDQLEKSLLLKKSIHK